ncbi:MAG: ATP-dependent RNA helicase HrpA [Candidatus Aminicenantes bacterium]|nr:ATP-dependent RNA helicase HrpA [Candidatus Aminicenantes bacterium]
MLIDQAAVLQQIEKLWEKARISLDEKTLCSQLSLLEKRLERSIAVRKSRELKQPKITYPQELPIAQKKHEIIQAVQKNPVVIISGETGCGKSTQIPKMCLAAGRGIAGRIALTQPRRVAAITIAYRIAEELKEQLGRSVGYKIRFEDKSSPESYIKVVTDGMLLAETQTDPKLYEYDTLIIDEAHERSLNIDFLLGLSKTLLKMRPELKIIITSATMDTEKFSQAFSQAPVIEVKGRLYPVKVEYFPGSDKEGNREDIDYVSLAATAVDRIKTRKKQGDILVFMPTEQDILETCEKLEGRKYSGTSILPLYARLPGAKQRRVYTVKGPKIVVATNVAETSLTIPGIKYVIDTGLARISQYLPGTKTNSLPISPISRSSADQRMGRCGRVQEGVCTRLFSQKDYESRIQYTPPEIVRSNLAEVILRMIYLKLGHPANFPFVDKPHPKNIKDGFDTLIELGALERHNNEYKLTEKGCKMARMPLDPRISRILLQAHKEGCLPEAAVIASALSIRDPRERPPEKAAQADLMHLPFRNPDSDFLTLLNIWNRYHDEWEHLSSQNKKRKFCREHFLSFNRMREWILVHEQVLAILQEMKIYHNKKASKDITPSLYAEIHRSILAGYLSNIAVHKEKNIYTAPQGREAMIFPGSGLFNRSLRWIVAAETVKTSRLFARTAARIDPAWLEELAGPLCKYFYLNPRWDKKRGEVVAEERVTLFGLEIISGRTISYGRINPAEAHQIFIHSALVKGNIHPLPDFLKYNLELINKLSVIEEKLRRRDILVSEGVLEDFYSDRLPGVLTFKELIDRIASQGSDNFLRLTREDILKTIPDQKELEAYPDEIKLDNMNFKTQYRFSPGKEEDGITLKIPARLLSSVPKETLEGTIPGLYKEKITALIRGLPKCYRRKIVPVGDKVEDIVKNMPRESPSLFKDLSSFIRKKYSIQIPIEEWHKVELPGHLKFRLAIIGQKGHDVTAGRDLERLLQELGSSSLPEESEAWKKAQLKWERSGITSWDFDHLPEKIPVGSLTEAYPALHADKEGISIRLYKNHEEALKSHLLGVEALLLKRYSKDLEYMKRHLVLPEEYSKSALFFGGKEAIEKWLYSKLRHEVFRKNFRSQKEFTAYKENINIHLNEKSLQLLSMTIEILSSYQKIRSILSNIKISHPNNQALQNISEQTKRELEKLIPANFLDLYHLERLKHLPRYAEALRIRLERAKNDPEKDRKKAEQVSIFIHDLERIQRDYADKIDQDTKNSLDDFRWMIEEFKVSLFAPELKTAYPVSPKRLLEARKKIEETSGS